MTCQRESDLIRMGPIQQMSNDIGMSRQMVDHYMRFKDQLGLAADGQCRLRLVTKEP
jgi:hypothetical protein